MRTGGDIFEIGIGSENKRINADFINSFLVLGILDLEWDKECN